MTEGVAWAGVIGTFVFGAISLLQFIREVINSRVRQSEEAHLESLGNSLAHLRMMCSEATNSGEIIKTDASRQFLRQIGWSLLTAENHVSAIAESIDSNKAPKKSLEPQKETNTGGEPLN